MSQTPRRRWDWQPAITRGTNASQQPVLGRYRIFDGLQFRTLTWHDGRVTNKVPVSVRIPRERVPLIVQAYTRRRTRLMDLMYERDDGLERLTRYTGLVARFLEDAAEGLRLVEGGLVEALEMAFSLPAGWFDAEDKSPDIPSITWPAFDSMAVLSARESGRASWIDDWVTADVAASAAEVDAQSGSRRLARRSASLSMPFPVIREEARALLTVPPPNGIVYRQLSGSQRSTWRRRVWAARQNCKLEQALAPERHLVRNERLTFQVVPEALSEEAASDPLPANERNHHTSSAQPGEAEISPGGRGASLQAVKAERTAPAAARRLAAQRIRNIRKLRNAFANDPAFARVLGLSTDELEDEIVWSTDARVFGQLLQSCGLSEEGLDEGLSRARIREISAHLAEASEPYGPASVDVFPAKADARKSVVVSPTRKRRVRQAVAEELSDRDASASAAQMDLWAKPGAGLPVFAELTVPEELVLCRPIAAPSTLTVADDVKALLEFASSESQPILQALFRVLLDRARAGALSEQTALSALRKVAAL